MQRIVVVDAGAGNLHSVSKALERVAPGDEVVVTRDPELVAGADRVVLPGQGAMGSWFAALDAARLRASVVAALDSKPVLGICLGLHALLDASEEDGGVPGMAWVAGLARRFARPADSAFKVPHMGWSRVARGFDHPLWRGIPDGSRFYFAHSYYAEPRDPAVVAGRTDYILGFCSALAKGGTFAVQFHPEKSHAQGLALLRNFVSWRGD